MLFATTGMRRSEVAGLRVVDLDLDAARVSPRLPRVLVDHQVVVSGPETRAGRRSLALDRRPSRRSKTTGSSRPPSRP
jgi:integrase